MIRRWYLWLLALQLLTGCIGNADLRAINQPGISPPDLRENPTNIQTPFSDENLIGMAFSGGGMRASAFSYGVLKSLSEMQSSNEDRNLTDEIGFISGVSGGSVTAAYFALKPQSFYDFHEVFLDKNAEEGLSIKFSVTNLLRIWSFGGANDQSGLPVWLDNNVFHGATYADVMNKQPVLLISASDIFNRTPFVFNNVAFRPLCSDLSKLPIAQAVAASAAVPGAFTPVNVESFADQCEWEEPPVVTNAGSYYGLQSISEALWRYRDTSSLKYIKLLDGGLTDNFGIRSIVLARLAAGNAYTPINKERAIRLKRLLFVVVNSGRGPKYSKWNMELNNPNVGELTAAVTNTAIESNVHITYDFLQLVMSEWQDSLKKWRCSLSKEEVNKALRGKSKGWKCDDVHFFVTQVAFDGAGAQRQERLDNIPTRFVLPKDDINFLIESADISLNGNEVFNTFLENMK